MKPTCILINPWIYDFAALNLWARPLGLLKVAEYLSQFEIDLKLIDCIDILEKSKKFGTGKYPRQIIEKPEILKAVPKNYARYGMSLDAFKETFKRHLPCDLVCVTSIMTYWYPGVQKAIEIIKDLSPHTPVILGGVYATLCNKHASENSGADYVFKGGIAFRELNGSRFSELHIEQVIKSFGFTLNKKDEPKPYYRLGLYQHYPFAPILTGMGCPYRCSYCASPVLFTGFCQSNPSSVLREIKELYDIGIKDYAFYDDALLVNAGSHIRVILNDVIKRGLNVRFHCPNGIHAKFIDDELAYLMKRSGFKTIRLGLETVDPERQIDMGGKVTPENLISAVRMLKKNGLTKQEIGVYLMYGLPGQRLEEVKEGVELLKSLGVRIHLTEFSPIPFTQSWEELKDRGVITDNTDPLLTNNSVFARLYSGYDLNALEKIKLDVKKYNSS